MKLLPIASSSLLVGAILLSACSNKAPETNNAVPVDEAPVKEAPQVEVEVEVKAMMIDAGVGQAAIVVGSSTPESDAAFVATTQVQSLTATVVSINLETREVVLTGENENERKITLSEDARNLAQVSPGDIVNVKFIEHVTMELVKGDNMNAFEANIERDVRSEEGEMPLRAKMIKTVAAFTVEAIDTEASTFTLKSVEEISHTFTAKDPANLAKASIGDAVAVTTTKVVAMEVTKAP